MYMYTCTDNIEAFIHNYISRIIFEIKIYIESLYLNFIQYLDALLDHTYLDLITGLMAINGTCHFLQNV